MALHLMITEPILIDGLQTRTTLLHENQTRQR